MTLTTAITLGKLTEHLRYDAFCPVDHISTLSDILATPVEARVSKGVAWLEEQGAYDWPEKILGAGLRFRMSHCARCAVGVTLGDYTVFVKRCGLAGDPVVMREEGLRHGFSAMTTDGYAELEQAWIDRATAEMKWRNS